jgi:hypothetical protein
MKKKIFINAFYNLALILCTIGVFWAYENSSPLIIIFFVAVFASILFFKIRLIKDLRKELKSGVPPQKK